MATKKELEARIAALEVEVALLRAERVIQQPVIIQPSYPVPSYSGTWPYITYGYGTLSVNTDPGDVTVN